MVDIYNAVDYYIKHMGDLQDGLKYFIADRSYPSDSSYYKVAKALGRFIKNGYKPLEGEEFDENIVALREWLIGHPFQSIDQLAKVYSPDPFEWEE